MDDLDRKILEAVRDGIPLTERPFRDVAQAVGIDEEDLIKRINDLRSRGVIRRFGASIDQHKLGIKANAVVAWKVHPDQITRAAEVMAGNRAFSHCYERGIVPGVWEYNLYTVIHGHDRGSVTKLVRSFAESIGVEDYCIFFSTRSFKGSGNGPSRSED